MSAHRKFNPTLAEVATAYGVTRQNIAYHSRKFSRDVVASPESYLTALIESSKASELRAWLSVPINRKRAELRLELYRQAGELRKLRSEARQIQIELTDRIEELNRQARQ
jgi:hypothetical protein